MRFKPNREVAPKPISSSVCYCDGKRELGSLELFCAICRKWFHGRCLKDLTDFYGLPFMVCYVFNCQECSPTKAETWTPKQANFVHMCVTVLANLTYDEIGDLEDALKNETLIAPVFFNIDDKIIPYFIAQWENLTSMTRRVKNTWHQTLLKALTKESLLFEVYNDGKSFALRERDLLAIGPAHEPLRQIGKSKVVPNMEKEQEKSDDVCDGPKTRGYKRRNAEGSTAPKKTKYTADYASTRIAGIASLIDFPFNREGYRYYLVEKDFCVPNREIFEQEDVYGKPIPAHTYRIAIHPTVTLSPNDRAFQLKLSDDRLTAFGFEGYCLVRATHPICQGTYYYEAVITSQPPESHFRIGWSQAVAPVQACVGYNQFSYAWRSAKGTVFHQARGTHYSPGFKEGDVLGFVISLPLAPSDLNYNFEAVCSLPSSSSYLFSSHKDLPLINFKHNYFYEEKDDIPTLIKELKPAPGSYIEFFLNGVSCGVAFRDIYAGFYFPAISIFQSAAVKCNFGPDFVYPCPNGAKGMCERPEEMQLEQTISDILFLVENEDNLAEIASNFAS